MNERYELFQWFTGYFYPRPLDSIFFYFRLQQSCIVLEMNFGAKNQSHKFLKMKF
jgi:hypothetical protein